MAFEKFFPFRSVSGDRKYSAEDWAAYFAQFIGNGVFFNNANSLKVVENEDMKVTVKPGAGFAAGRMYILESEKVLAIDTADGAAGRIDRIVLRCDYVNRTMGVAVIKGGYEQTAPALTRNADVYELALADIYVAAGTLTITAADITDQRLNTELCGIVTGLVKQADTTDIYNQLQAYLYEFEEKTIADFEYWYANYKATLSGDVEGNLFRLIEETKTQLDNQIVETVGPKLEGSKRGGIRIESVESKYEQENGNVKGKNLLDCRSLKEETLNGVTFTPIFDKDGNLEYVNVNGKASADTKYTLRNDFTVKKDVEYKTTGCPKGGSAATYCLSGVGIDTGDGAQKKITNDGELWVQICVYSGVTVSNLEFKPMIRKAAITDNTYVPYGLLRFKAHGKNLLKTVVSNTVQSGINVTKNNDGSFNVKGTSVEGFNLIVAEVGIPADLLKNGCTGVLSLLNAEYDQTKFNLSISYWDPEGTIRYVIPNKTTTIPAGSVIQACKLFIASGQTVDFTNVNIQFEEGTAATEFEPYKENSVVISQQNEQDEIITDQLPATDQIALCSMLSYDGVTYIECDCEGQTIIKVKYGTNSIGAVTLENSNLHTVNSILRLKNDYQVSRLINEAAALRKAINDINAAIPYTVVINDNEQTIDFVDRSVEDGQESGETLTLTDGNTGKSYALYVRDGELRMREVSGV